jgi:hypothetical protein
MAYTIDDLYGDVNTKAKPTFAGQWKPVGGSCPQCTVLNGNGEGDIDVNQVQNGTWHSTTVGPNSTDTSISVNFTGNPRFSQLLQS